MAFELNILGGVDLRQDGRSLPLGPPQRRAVLGLLATAAGRTRSVAELTAGLWDGAPPSTAATALQVHVHHLRRVLGEASGLSGLRLVTTRSPVAAEVRYALELPADALDVERHRMLHHEGMGAYARGDLERARRAFTAADALWKGEPLAGLAPTAMVRQARSALVDERQRMLADRELLRSRGRATDAGASARKPPQQLEGLRFEVLGPVRAWRGEEPISTGAPQQKALLAALLLHGGRTAPAAELVDALWGENPPSTALAALRSYAFRLRKVLGPHALVTDSGGYALRVAPDALDYSVVADLAAEADRIRVSDPARSRELLGQALKLWHGEPLVGLPGPYAETQRSRLAEWHLTLLESRLELDLELGAHAETVSELTALSAEHPLRERLRALLMLALYRSGRQAEALGVYADTRRLLADELGIDPSFELSYLHQRILQADPGLQVSSLEDRSGGVGVPRPSLLPATVADFTGRAYLVRELSEELSRASQTSPVMAVSAVAGIGGVGKTALAVHIAHIVREQFPDGQMYVDLQGTDARPAEPEAVLGTFLRALGVPDSAIPETLAERAMLYRMTLDGRRVLVLLDNAHDAAQVRQLLPGTPGCAALVTSRVRMVDLAGAHLVDLDVMSPDEALELFTRIVGEERVRSEQQAALDVVAACGFLPLAIRIAAARLAARRSWTVSVLAHRLADHRRRLDELRAGDLAVKATFALGYAHLSRDQARAFRLLSLPDGPDISLEAAAAVLGLEAFQAEELLEALVDVSLIETTAPARYRYKDLLRLYARECAEGEETPEEHCAALSRLLDFYLASAASAYELDNPGDRVLDHLVRATRTALTFSTRGQGLEWLFREARGLLASAEQAADGGCEGLMRRAVDLLWVAQDLMESGIHARQYRRAARALATTANRCADPLVEGRARLLSGQLLRAFGRIEEAEVEVQHALTLGITAHDPLTNSYALNVRAALAYQHRRFEECAHYCTSALERFRQDGNPYGEAVALSNLSRAQLELGAVQFALEASAQAVEIYRRLGAGFRLGNGLYAMALALDSAGRSNEAHSCLTEALQIFREAHQKFWEGMTLYRLATVHLTAGRWRQSASLAERALVLLREVGGDWRTANALTLLGRVLEATGQTVRAHACWQDALKIYTTLQSPEAQDVRALLSAGPAPSNAL